MKVVLFRVLNRYLFKSPVLFHAREGKSRNDRNDREKTEGIGCVTDIR